MTDLIVPNSFVSGTTIDSAAMNANFSAISTLVNTTGVPKVQSAIVSGASLTSGLAAQTGLSGAGDSDVRRGKTIIATAEGTTSSSYTFLATPDVVTSVVLPTDCILRVRYQAHWQVNTSGTMAAAIFLGTDQVKVPAKNGVPTVSECTFGVTGNAYCHLGTTNTTGATLVTESSSGNSTTDVSNVTTGQVAGPTATSNGLSTGYVDIFAAPGTYDVGIKFKTSSGTVTVKNRKLWVEVVGY